MYIFVLCTIFTSAGISEDIHRGCALCLVILPCSWVSVVLMCFLCWLILLVFNKPWSACLIRVFSFHRDGASLALSEQRTLGDGSVCHARLEDGCVSHTLQGVHWGRTHTIWERCSRLHSLLCILPYMGSSLDESLCVFVFLYCMCVCYANTVPVNFWKYQNLSECLL